MTKNITPAPLLADFYKLSHREQYPKGTEYVYSVLTARSNKFFPEAEEIVVFGIQAFIQKYLIEYFNDNFFNRPFEDVEAEYTRIVKNTLGDPDPETSHLEELHDLGFLPLSIKALPEGTKVPFGTPIMTYENTRPEFFWLTNFLETITLAELWQPMTSATIAYHYRSIMDEAAMETVGNTDLVGIQGHDFSMRGMSSLEAAQSSGAGHLTSFIGTDSIPAINYLEEYYGADVEKEAVCVSIPATEHSVMSVGADENQEEYDMFKYLLTEVYPSGFFSVVSDTYDFWKIVGEVIPSLKETIMNRDGRMVVRPDSGDPAEVLCGMPIYTVDHVEEIEDLAEDEARMEAGDECGDGVTGRTHYSYLFNVDGAYYHVIVKVEYDRMDKRYYYVDSTATTSVQEYEPSVKEKGLIQSLWDTFGGETTEKGYKLLDSHVGAIYGDAITPNRVREINRRLKEKGFASANVVFGIGGFNYSFVTRDTLGFAMKATWAQVNGEQRLVYKDPKTDTKKRSQRGRVRVYRDDDGSITYEDGLHKTEDFENNLLLPIFSQGQTFVETTYTLEEIRSYIQGKVPHVISE